MNSSYTAYRLLTASSSLVLVPLIWVHHRLRGDDFQRFFQRMGTYPNTIAEALQGRPRIWIHAVSVGEVGVAAAIAKALRRRYPGSAIALSSIREQGLARARELLGEIAACFFAPLDLVGPTRKALQVIQPDILVLLETEIWPNLIVGARRTGARIVIANGRISSRSIRRYRKVRSLMRYTLSHVDAFSMISSKDAHRIQLLGAPAHRVGVNGNAKFDCPDPLVDMNAGRWAGRLYGVQSQTPVFVAGSTRNPEEQFILDAFIKIRSHHPGAVLIIAPRHIERTPQIAQWVADRGLRCQLRTTLDGVRQPRTAPVVILDTIGELSATYSVANMVFCGGSLVPKGGQNIMEPAMWGKPVCYGPSMDDFADARQMIQSSGGGVMVRNAEELAATVIQWLQHPRKAIAAGQAARQAILPHRGAAQKHADVICRLLADSPAGRILTS
jgi:3-deoxy-D-manno-octulosonic-acid transferase